MTVTETRTYPTIREAMTIADIADLAGLEEGTIRHYYKQKQGGLPRPKAIVGRTPLWERPTVQDWIDNRRGPGRPTKA